MQLKGSSIRTLAIRVCDYLSQNGVEVVLSGGACVAIYTDNKYMSYDLDFVLISGENQKKMKGLLLDAGFYESEMFFKHKDTDYFLHFVSPPLSIGEEPVKKIHEIREGKSVLKLLSPTDCVKDRLASFYYWNDKQALDQAVMVAGDNRINISEVKRWSIKEDQFEKFKVFLERVKGKSLPRT